MKEENSGNLKFSNSEKKFQKKYFFIQIFFFDYHGKNLRHIDENLNRRFDLWTVKAAIASYKQMNY